MAQNQKNVVGMKNLFLGKEGGHQICLEAKPECLMPCDWWHRLAEATRTKIQVSSMA